MEGTGLISFTVVLIIASSILQIILFFKIWGMTNNMTKLKSHFITPTSDIGYRVRKYVLMGEKDKAKELAISHFIESVQTDEKRYQSELSQYPTSNVAGASFGRVTENFLMHKSALEKQFAIIGAEIPAVIKNLNSFEEYLNLFKEKE